jgi:hypothetical protein
MFERRRKVVDANVGDESRPAAPSYDKRGAER